MSQEPLRQGNREPAGVISLEGSLAQPESLTEKAVVLDIKCLKSNPPEPITSLARQMRIKGLACQPGMGPLTLSEVQNHANGYVATTFHLGPSQFTTDYIDLVKGSNQITIDLADGQGHHQQVELTVIRE